MEFNLRKLAENAASKLIGDPTKKKGDPKAIKEWQNKMRNQVRSQQEVESLDPAVQEQLAMRDRVKEARGRFTDPSIVRVATGVTYLRQEVPDRH